MTHPMPHACCLDAITSSTAVSEEEEDEDGGSDGAEHVEDERRAVREDDGVASSSSLGMPAASKIPLMGGSRAGGGPGGSKGSRWKKAIRAALEAGGAGQLAADDRDLPTVWAERVVRLYGHARRYYGLLLGTQVEWVGRQVKL